MTSTLNGSGGCWWKDFRVIPADVLYLNKKDLKYLFKLDNELYLAQLNQPPTKHHHKIKILGAEYYELCQALAKFIDVTEFEIGDIGKISSLAVQAVQQLKLDAMPLTLPAPRDWTKTPDKSEKFCNQEDMHQPYRGHETKIRWTSGNTEEFLSFEPTERPKWREATISGNIDAIPPVSEMVRNIMQYRKRYLELKTLGAKKRILRDLLHKYLCNVQKEENTGVKMQSKTMKIMKELDSETCMNKTKRMSDGGNLLEKEYPIQQSSEFESDPSLEENLAAIHKRIKSSRQDLKPLKSEAEVRNLGRTYNFIVDELNRTQSAVSIDSENDDQTQDCPSPNTIDDYIGVIELHTLILQTHRILMKDVMKNDQMPGIFSVNERQTEFEGKVYRYPWFQDVTVAEIAVQTLVDKMNDIRDGIKYKSVGDVQILNLFFKCASIFLFAFLTLHPFSAGNGRLARLLASFYLRTFSPFMTPVYNVFSFSREFDYLQVYFDARANLQIPEKVSVKEEAVELTISIMRQKPVDLCAMLIESNWTMWRQLLFELGDQSIKLFDWEFENQQSLKRAFEVA